MIDTSPSDRVGRAVPEIEPGLTVLRTPRHRSTALHRVAVEAIRRSDGRAFWLDARNAASTYALHDLAPRDRLLRRVRLARAFTAYQHFSLVERLVNAVSPRTGCVVAPNVASLYRDDDVPDHEARPLLDAALSALAQACDAYGVPLLATDAGPDDRLAGIVRERATRELRCEETDLGYRFEGDDFETDVYWQEGHWQTTVPYWVELVGAAEERTPAESVGPVTPSMLEG